MFSVRIVDADFYMTKPVAGLDVLYSEFHESNVSRVPILRIFGSTPSGQKTCLHVHQVFPYIFVPYDGTQPSDKYLKQFATSVDFAVQIALGKASSSTHHVHHASIVKRIPFYGYHEEEQDFILIQFYNPRIIARVVELLQNGAILNKVFQPYEAHIPYILQFLIDFNLYGMNLLHAGKAMFRGWVTSEINGPTRQPSPCSESSSPFSANMSGLSHVSATVYQHWSEKTITSGLRLASDVPKTSRCELEVDIVSTDILNQLEIGTSIGANPGIMAMWEDEKQRRRQHDQSSQITLPVSQDRGDLPILDAEKAFKATIREIISKRSQLVQSQLDKMEKSQVDSLSPEDFQELSQSILLDAKEPENPVMLSEDVDENEPIVDETVIEDVLQASLSQSQRLSGRFDSDLIDILVSLADDPNEPAPQECSQKSGTSEAVVAEDRLAVDESEDENEDEESFLMSQPVWQDHLSGRSEELFCGEISEDAEDVASKPSSVPQLDGAVDEETDVSNIPLSTSFIAPKKKDEGYSTERKYSSFSSAPEVEEKTRSDRFRLRIPQLDGCHDDKDDKHRDEAAPSSTCEKRALKSSFHENEVEELEDFRIEKRRRAGRTRQAKGGSQNKANSTTRQRKTTGASLAVSGGDTKTRKTSSCEATTSITEATTSESGHAAKRDARGHRGEAKSARVGDDTSSREGEDLVSLLRTRDTGWAAFGKEDEISPKKNSQRILLREAEVSSCPITSAAAEVSSESQTSDFELRLSDSSSDNSDFKSSVKISRISSLGSDRRSAAEDLSGFGKPEKAGETVSPFTDNAPSFGLVCKSRNKEVAGNSRNIKARRDVDSEKFSENSTKNSKPGKRRRTRVVGCLEFTVQNAMPEAKGNSPLKFEAALPSRKAGNSRKRTRSDKRSKEDGSRGRKRKKADEDDVEVVLGSSEEGRVYEKHCEKEIKTAKNAALLHACVKLEKLCVEKGKRGYKVIREDSEKRNTCLIENEKCERKKVEKDSEESERISGGNEKHDNTVFQKDFEVIREDSEKLNTCIIENEKCKEKKVEKDSEKSERISGGNEKQHDNTVIQKDFDKPGRLPIGKGESQRKEVQNNSEHFEGFPAGKEKDKEGLKDVENFEMFSFENEKSKNILVVSEDSSKPKMLFTGNEKSKNSGLLKDFEKHGTSCSPSEQTDERGCPSLELPVVDEKLDLYSNALYQMAMLSPKSDPSEDQSPPSPSSPSLNTSPGELVHDLLGSLMKCETKDVEVKDKVQCVKDSLGSPWEGVDCDFDNHSMIEQSDEKELDVEADVPVRRSLVNELRISRHGDMQEDGNAVDLEDDEGRNKILEEAVKSDKITSSGASTVEDCFGFQDDERLETDSNGQEGDAVNLEDNEGRNEILEEAVKSDKITSSGASTVEDSFGFQDDESLETDSSGQEGDAVNLEDNEGRIEIPGELGAVKEPSGRCKIWKPVKDPPSLSYVLKTRDLYGLPHERHQKAFCSDPRDVPSVTRIVNGRRLQVPSLSVEELSEFDLGGNFRTVSEMRSRMGDQADNSFVRGCLRTLTTDRGSGDDRGYSGEPAHIKLALMGENDVVITPARFPPTLDIVRRWMDENRPFSVKNLASNASETRQIPNSSPKQDEGDDARERPTVPSTDETGITKTPKQGSFVNHDDVDEKIESSEEVPGFFQTPRSESRLSVSQGMAQLGHEGTGRENHVPRRSIGVSPGPQHSTPLGDEPKCRGLLRCTPIASGSSQKPGKGCSQQEVPINFVNDEQCSRILNLRRNILDSQTKENAGQGYRQASVDASYIEGPTPTNSCGFKISQPNIQDAKALHEIQYLTILSVELHIRTRKTLRPDPEFDAICAIFYNIEHETKNGKKNVTGVIVASNESTKLSRATDSVPSTSRDGSCCGDGVSTRDIGVTKGNSEGGISRGWSKESILRKSGLNDDVEIITVDEESEAISCFVKLVHDWDPDLFVGYEVQMLSWGYLLQRSTTLGIDLASQLSRLQDPSGTTRFDADKDKWGASHTSEIAIAGRIVLNVWRLMRHEVSLNIYSFENIAYHVLRERIPLYTFQQLSRWWDQKMAHSRWRTAEHYITRCQGNIRILNYSDLVNRTSEFARLFGILFYSVVSRGSQFRVESMMLRLAKPMNYVAVSPSSQQRARMCAPECIALVMEPESRFYTDPVVVLDFQSLYPTMIIAYNYCFSTCLGRVSHLNELGNFDFGCTSLNVPPGLLERLEDDIHVSANGAAFVKSNVRRGILPRMLEEILNTRIMVKKAMKGYKQDKALGKLLDARQLGLKLIANVTYGYTSANVSGRMPCVEIADAIVRKARETLERAIHLVNTREEWGARVVYGDTDSLFVLLKGATKEEAFKIGQEIVEAVTAANPKPVKLKFEKVYLPCVLQTKKRYVGYMYETLDQKEPVFDAKGIETVRRDNCPAVAKILEKSLRILFEARDVSLVKKFVQRQFRKLMEDRVSLQDFTFAKEYRGMRNYKPTACVPALSLAKRRLSRDRRAEPRVGERVPYVVVYGSPGLPLIQLVRSLEEVLNDPSLRLNAVYYINKQIIPPLNRAFGLIGIDVSTWYTELPRFAPRQQVAAAKQKSTISRYFTTLHCPVCEDLTHQGLCHACRNNPQQSVTILADRIRNWERKYDHLTQICFQCCGTRDTEMVCISLDCPVLFKMVKTKRSLSYAETLRDVQRKIEIANC